MSPLISRCWPRNIASVFRSAVERAGLRLNVECAPLPEPVFIDREMWEKIELNLLSNALKSTFEGEIRVRLTEADGDVQFTVTRYRNRHLGKRLAHLFERFQRIEGARRRSHEGSGIGLALVRELVEMHGGTIRVDKRDGTWNDIHRGASLRARAPAAESVGTDGFKAGGCCKALRWPTCRRPWDGCPGRINSIAEGAT